MMAKMDGPSQHVPLSPTSFAVLGPNLNYTAFPFRPFELTGDIVPNRFPNTDIALVDHSIPFPQPNTAPQPHPGSGSVLSLGPLRPSPSRETWNKNKLTIKRLYLDEDYTLRMVMDTMSKEFDFHATISMYKKRFKHWDFVKNNRLSDVRSIMNLKKQRQKEGKASRFELNGQPVNWKRLETYLQRKKMSPATFVATYSASGLESLARYISCRTPSPPPSFLQSPDVHRTSEAVIAACHNYVSAVFVPEKFLPDERERMRDGGLSIPFLNLVVICRRMLERNEFQQAGRLLRELAKEIEIVVKSHQTEGIFGFLYLVLAMNSEWRQAAMSLITQAAKLSRLYICSAQHPLRELLMQLSSCGEAVLIATVYSALDCYQDAASRFFGEDSVLTVDTWALLASTPSLASKLGSVIQRAERGVQRYELQFGQCDRTTLKYLLRIADLEIEAAGNLMVTMDVPRKRYEQILERVEHSVSCNWYFKHIAEYNLAWLYHTDGAHEAAERHMQAALDTVLYNGGNHTHIIDTCVILEAWLVNRGEHDKACEVRRMWEELILPDEGETLDSANANDLETE